MQVLHPAALRYGTFSARRVVGRAVGPILVPGPVDGARDGEGEAEDHGSGAVLHGAL